MSETNAPADTDDEQTTTNITVSIRSEPDEDAFDNHLAGFWEVNPTEVSDEYAKATVDVIVNWDEFCAEYENNLEHAITDSLGDFYYNNPHKTPTDGERTNYDLQVWDYGHLVRAVSGVDRDVAKNVESDLISNDVITTNPEIEIHVEEVSA